MRKVATDEKTTTFEHEKGHKMVILHAALPKIQQEQLKRLALHKGGKVKKLAEGTPDSPLEQTESLVDDLRSKNSPDAAPPADDATTVTAPGSHDTHITINAAPPAGAPAPVAPVPVVAQAPVAAPPVVAPVQAAPAPVPAQPNAPAQDFALKQEAAAKEALNSQLVQKQQQQTDILEMKKHLDDFDAYQKAHPINSRAYVESMDSDRQTKTAIGLALGALAGGGTHNIVADYLNKQIDRDVDAQKKNFENRSTVYGAYQHLYDNEVVATNLAKASTGDILAQRMNIAAAQLGTPQAMQNNATFQANWGAKKDQLLQGAAQGLNQPGQEDTILRPGANLLGAQANPTAQKDYDQIRTQFDRATQADKALKSIDATYNRMTDSSGEGGYSGYFHRQIAPKIDHIPYVGGVFHAVEKAVTDSPEAREFDSAQSELYKTIRAALPEAGDAAIEEVVNANSPERGDDEAAIHRKKKTIKDFIKRNTHTSLLGPIGLTNPESP